jgi:membrane associated rhomboid family serine protease
MTTTIVRSTLERAILDEWSLVLAAADIDHRTDRDGDLYRLMVEPARAAEAVRALADYDLERRRRRARWYPADHSANTAWLVASAILAIEMWLGSTGKSAVAVALGANRTDALLAGEIWRPATALTLHANGLHALSNAAAALLFLSPLCRLLGGGTAFALALVSGISANILNALWSGAGYSGIGASTAVFAAVGLLAGARWTRSDPEPLWRRLRPLGAALGILAMLGASPETDVSAHLLGLVVGAALGIGFTRIRPRPFNAAGDNAAGATGAAIVASAWIAAVSGA